MKNCDNSVEVGIFKAMYEYRNTYPLGIGRGHEDLRVFKYIRDEIDR